MPCGSSSQYQNSHTQWPWTCVSLTFKWHLLDPLMCRHVRGVCVFLCVFSYCTVHICWSRSVSGSVFHQCISVCLRPLGATVRDKVSCPLRPHLHRHPSWCHLSWPRTKLSPWEKTACSPCSESTQPCPAPTQACSASALLRALITALLLGLCTHRNMERQEGTETLMASWAITTGVVGYVTAVASEWGLCLGRCCPGTSIH